MAQMCQVFGQKLHLADLRDHRSVVRFRTMLTSVGRRVSIENFVKITNELTFILLNCGILDSLQGEISLARSFAQAIALGSPPETFQ
jgi:hypothetical protein